MPIPEWLWFSFIFAFGCCIGSFLNVVIYRLPRDKSLVSPPSACPGCGKHIRFYDNIPLFSWLLLGRKCRYCKEPISARYFVIELLTGLVFIGVFFLFFRTELRRSMPGFMEGGWFVYLIYITMLAGFIAASAIDLELWVIPLSICWFVTAAGLVGSAAGGYIVGADLIRGNYLLPVASANTAALAAGAGVGLVISLILLRVGLIKRSYEWEDESETAVEGPGPFEDGDCNHRVEVCREIIFLLPILACSLGAYWAVRSVGPIRSWWVGFSQIACVAGFLGSLWGYFVGCGVVWATRILGTLGFGKEAMGLGDVHLMGAAGAVVGPLFVVPAFFIAPFFGLAWAGVQMFFKKIRQIPYGPFLSLGVIVVIILHDVILGYAAFIFFR